MNDTSSFFQGFSFRRNKAVIGWLALCYAASFSAVFISTDGWYAELHKPPWSPPLWIYGRAWTMLYALMAFAAWLVWREGGWKKQGWALGLFLAQWLLNALWAPLFFGLHHPGLAFVEIVALWIVLMVTLVAFWRVRRTAGVLLVPYLAWVTQAAILNYTIMRMNP